MLFIILSNMNNFIKLVIIFVCCVAVILGKVEIVFLKNEQCVKNTPITINATIRSVNATHYLMNAIYTSTIPNGNNIKIKLNVFAWIRTKWIHMFAMDNNEGACDNMNRYARGLFHDLQRRVKMKPGVCPIAPGRYMLENYYVDINTVNFNTFPKGKLRLLAELIEKATNNMALCYEVILETR